jgi:hypothetical protein
VNEKRKGIWKAVVLAALFMSAQLLLKEDGKVFAVWWLTVLVLGWCSFSALPVSFFPDSVTEDIWWQRYSVLPVRDF